MSAISIRFNLLSNALMSVKMGGAPGVCGAVGVRGIAVPVEVGAGSEAVVTGEGVGSAIATGAGEVGLAVVGLPATLGLFFSTMDSILIGSWLEASVVLLFVMFS